MSLNADKDSQRRRRSDGQNEEIPPAAERRGRRKRPSDDVGDALRSAYQRTVNEDIPAEMLDLLGKLD